MNAKILIFAAEIAVLKYIHYICALHYRKLMKRLLPIIATLLCAFVSCSKTSTGTGKLEINERGYFETRGVNVLVYSNNY